MPKNLPSTLPLCLAALVTSCAPLENAMGVKPKLKEGPRQEMTMKVEMTRERAFSLLKKELGQPDEDEVVVCDSGEDIESIIYQLGKAEMVKKLGLVEGNPDLFRLQKGEEEGENIRVKETFVEVDGKVFQLPEMQGKIVSAETAGEQVACALVEPPDDPTLLLTGAEAIYNLIRQELGAPENDELVYCDEGESVEKEIYPLGTIEMAKKLGMIPKGQGLIGYIKSSDNGTEAKETVVSVGDQYYRLPAMEAKIISAKSIHNQTAEDRMNSIDSTRIRYACILVRPPARRQIYPVKTK